MTKQTQLLLDIFTKQPKLIFLVDGVGACVSAFFLGVILTAFHESIGLSLSILFVLGGLALLFAVYSLSCYYFSAHHRPFLLIIILANTFYTILTLILVFFYSNLTVLGLLYFSSELLVVGVLLFIEVRILLRRVPKYRETNSE